MEDIHTSVKNYLISHGRALEKAKYNYIFNGGSKADITNALQAYQNEDGGFAHALEPDFTTDESNPIDTWTAVKTLRLIDLPKDHPLIMSTLRYLDKTPYNENGYYYYSIPSINDTPHAPWWQYSETRRIQGYNPTASLVGFILKYAEKDSPFYMQTYDFYQTMISDFINNPSNEVHELNCFVELYEDVHLLFDTTEFKNTLKTQIIQTVNPSPQDWFTTYTAKPSDLIHSPETPGYSDIKNIVTLENNLLLTTRNKDGVWDITWTWGQYDAAFEKAKEAWKSILAFDNYYRIIRFKAT
ncbi:MAG: hypothetical protein ACOCU2_00425 [Bacillota bacterium]